MTDRAKTIVSVLITAAAAAAFCWGFFAIDRHYRTAKPEAIINTRVDTLIVHDTTLVIRPKITHFERVDTVYLPADTVTLHDTLYVALSRERITADSCGLYHVVASGVQPSIDTVAVYPQTVYVTRNVTLPPKRWGIGVTAGVGVGYNGSFIASPYIGIGITYDIVQF